MQTELDADTCIAVGLVPAAISNYNDDSLPTWLQPAEPAPVLAIEPEVNFEEIAAFGPDLILGQTGRVDPVYAEFSRIAPTVAWDGQGPWRPGAALLARALGREARYAQVLAEVEERIAAARRDSTGALDERTLAVLFGGEDFMVVRDERHPFMAMFGEIGARLLRVPGELDGSGTPISEETLGELEPADLLITIDFGGLSERLTQGLFPRLPAVRAGRVLEISPADSSAFYGGPLAGSYFIHTLLPRILDVLG